MATLNDAIFLLGGDGGKLERVPEQGYDSEDLLQRLIADHPDLLAGEQIDPDDPVRWLLVSREAGVPDADGASDRWAVDHLLIDQHGRPTFVEVKRSTNSEVRRAVVGQLLDYAANAQTYFPLDRIRTLAAERRGGAVALDEAVLALLGPNLNGDPETQISSFWHAVDEKLRRGEVRLLFVADKLPRELRRVIEFLNEQMQNIEVLGIEVRQYVGETIRALVPRVVGQTESAREAKGSSLPRSKTTREEFVAACPEHAQDYFAELIDEAQRRGVIVSWGGTGFSLRARRQDGSKYSLCFAYPRTERRNYPFIDVYLEELKDVRGRFLAVAPFKERGAFTLHLPVTSGNIESARRVASVIWEVARELEQEPLAG
jgi:hypothetical protein